MKVYVVLWEVNPDSYDVLCVTLDQRQADFRIKQTIKENGKRYDLYDFEIVESYLEDY